MEWKKKPEPLDAFLAKQQMVESGGDPNAVSPVGAQGVAQVMPATWKQYSTPKGESYAVTVGDEVATVHGKGVVPKGASPFDPEAAGIVQRAYMKDILNMRYIKGDLRRAAAAYNAGPTRISRIIKAHGDEWEHYIPRETKGYLAKIFQGDLEG